MGVFSELPKRTVYITVGIILITLMVFSLLFLENQKYKSSINQLLYNDLSLFSVRINSNIYLLEELIHGEIISRDQLIIEQETQFQMINAIQRDTLLLKNLKKDNSKDLWATEDRLTKFSSFLNKLILTEQPAIKLSKELILEVKLEYDLQKKWSTVFAKYTNENDSFKDIDIEDASKILNEMEAFSKENTKNN